MASGFCWGVVASGFSGGIVVKRGDAGNEYGFESWVCVFFPWGCGGRGGVGWGGMKVFWGGGERGGGGGGGGGGGWSDVLLLNG